MNHSYQHEVSEHLYIVVVGESLEYLLHVLVNLNLGSACLQQRVHALERRLADGERLRDTLVSESVVEVTGDVDNCWAGIQF